MGRVLVIDDDPDYSQMLVHQLSFMGHEAVCAATLAEGIDALSAFAPDVVFLDVNLPDGNGLEAIGRVSEGGSRPEVIIITGRGEPDGAETAVRGGAWDYVPKGGSFTDVVLALRRALEYREQRQVAVPRALDLGGIVGRSSTMLACFDQLAQAAGSDANVLVTGDSGTGKELFAWAIHRNGRRGRKSFVVVDCAALPENLVESMLFGHRKGAFTGAAENRAGLVEQADGGTLFLDEVAEMPLTLQKAFLRVLQEKRFRPVGAEREVRSDFRLVAATNRNPEQMVREGRFRADLLFRLRALSIHIPPLRERPDDLRDLVHALVARVCDREGVDTKGVAADFYDVVARYSWPGNVRELEHAIEHAVAAAGPDLALYPIHLPAEIRACSARARLRALEPVASGPPPSAPAAALSTLHQVRETTTKRYLVELLTAVGGDIDEACRISDVSRSRFYALLKEHDVSRPG